MRGSLGLVAHAVVLAWLGAFVLAACSSQAAPAEAPLTIVLPTTTLASTPAPTLAPRANPSPTSRPVLPEALRGFSAPIKGACLPSSDNFLPNAPRAYRGGTHEGIDFYAGQVCVLVGRGTPVLAAKRGVVTRADLAYRSPTREEMERLLTISQRQGYTDQETLDVLRGRQVWVDHGGGVVTRYAHLHEVAPGIRQGLAVEAGTVIGSVGNSGIIEGLDDPDAELHLHFEIRFGEGYLGQGMAADVVRELLAQAFAAGEERPR